MPKPLEICLEDLHAAALGERYLRCVAIAGGERGLAIDADGAVSFRGDAPAACAIWVTADERLAIERLAGAPAVRVERSGRAIEAPEGKPVLLLAGDDVAIAGRVLRVHVHGEAAAIAEPVYVPEALLRGARAISAAVAVGAAVAGCAGSPGPAATSTLDGAATASVATSAAPSAAPPIEVRDMPPKPAPPPPPPSATPTPRK
jgi:hypothetical protein